MLRQGDHAPLLLVLLALLAVVAGTAPAVVRRRMRRRASFGVGAVLGVVATAGLVGLGGLLLVGPEVPRRMMALLPVLPTMPSIEARVPLPRVIRPTSPPPGDPLLRGIVTHVRDGDTIVVGRTPVRFEDVDCAERGTVAGDRATSAMRELADGRVVRCTLIGRRSYDREIGTCFLEDGRDVGGVMVERGLCRPWRPYR